MLADPPAPEPVAAVAAPVAEPKTETPEPEAAPVVEEAKVTEAEPGTAPETEPEVVEEELPDNVRKRIAKEVERQARADRAIAEAVSNRKAREAELAKLAADKPGSEPAPTTAPAAKEGKPTRPDLDTFPGTYAEYQTALKKYDSDHEAWLIAETERTVEAKLTARQRDETLRKDWDEATEAHGAEFPELMKTLASSAPEGLQLAISGLDNWSQVAVHLAKTPDELRFLARKFDHNPYAAVAELGRLEDRLQQASKPPEPAKVVAPARVEKPLPPPPARVGGSASATPKVDLEKADMRTFKREVLHLLER